VIISLPFLTSYDPPGTSEGTLDPLGLYQIADQLAIRLVPAVRERMQRIRFLTAMAVGAVVTEEIEDDPQQRDASPYLVWEWLIVEAFLRTMDDDPEIWGVPGTLVARRALKQHGYLDGTADERQYRVMTDRERWFRVVMGQDEVARLITSDSSGLFALPDAISNALSFQLCVPAPTS
jgi:hypothetical protein